MKKSYFIALAITIFCVVWIVSGAFSGKKPAKIQETAIDTEQDLVNVRTQDLTAETIKDIVTVTGLSQASKKVDLRSEIDGKITKIFFEEGKIVTKGDVILHIDKRDRLSRLNEAKELVAQRKIQYSAAQKLEDKGFNSTIRLAQAKAELGSAKANLKAAQVALNNTEIRAPFGGILNAQHVEIGDFVREGDDLFSIVDLDPIEFSGFVTEKQMLKLEKGQAGAASIMDGQRLEGTLSFVAPAADAQTRTFRILLKADNAEMKIYEGLTTQIELPAGETLGYKISPSVLTLKDDGTIGIRVVDDQNIVRFYPVTIVRDTDSHIIVSGLPNRIRLITVGQDFVVEGQTVTITDVSKGS